MGSVTQEPTYAVVWPRSPRGVQQRRRADRLDTLAGKRIAFLWDYLFRGDELFPVLARELTARFERVEIVGYEEFFVWVLIATIPSFLVTALVRVDPEFGKKDDEVDTVETA